MSSRYIDWIQNNKIFLIGVLIALITFWFTKEVPFFWDALSSSQLALWFYEHHFSQWVAPTEINPGHYPLWALMLSFVWMVLGKTILVSRLFLLTINIAIIYQIQKLIEYYKVKSVRWFWYLILFFEPTFWAQTTSINNDILMLFFCLLAVNNQSRNKLIYAFALFGILFSNLRGLFFVFGFFTYEVYKNPRFLMLKGKEAKSLYLVFIIPAVLFVAFGVYQYNLLGWVLRSPATAVHRGLVGIGRALKNMIAIVWEFSDHGRFLFLLFTCYYLFLSIKNKTLDPKSKELLQICLFLGIPTAVIMIISSNPVGHRYFVLFFMLLLLVFVNLMSYAKFFVHKWFVSFMMLISAHFWIYPETISQGWDASFAHLHYFELKLKMQDYLSKNKIPYSLVGAKTRNPSTEIEYLGSLKREQYVEFAAIEDVEYYVHTNVENSTKDEEIAVLKSKWTLIKEYKKLGVFVRLYKSPE